MKFLILYSSYGGATKSCVELLEKRLCAHHEVQTVSIREERAPAPEGFDGVVLAGSIRMGQLHKRLRAYIKEYKQALNDMPTAVCFCCGYTRQFEEYVSTQIPKDLTCSLGVRCFGGELKPEKLHGFDKLVVRVARSSIRSQDFEESDADHHPLPEIIPENVMILAEKMEALM